MSKLQKPNSIIFIGANLYKDFVQRAYLERVYPYIKDANEIYKYPTFEKEILDKIANSDKRDKKVVAMFILDNYCDIVYDYLDKSGYSYIDKSGSRIYSVDECNLIVKCIDIFSELPEITKIVNRNVSDFKLFGDANKLKELEKKLEGHAIIKKVLPTWFNIEVKDSEGEEILSKLAKELELKILPVKSVRAYLIEHLSKKCKTLSFAESCTGGLLVSKLIAISGASNVIEGSMVTYSNKIKKEWLGVKEETLQKYGAVSKECVKEMLIGIKQKANSNIAVAISGIAGPTGATEDKDVGTVYIGVLNEDDINIEKFKFNGDRGFVQEQAARSALEMIIYSEKDFFNFF